MATFRKTVSRDSYKAKKSLGQNFLMHSRIAERIVDTAKLSPGVTVLEIGPGTGMLTRPLLQCASKVIAIEADRELFEKLKIDFENEISSGKLELIHGDIRAYLLNSPIGKDSRYAVVANIPYYITGEIFRMFLESENQPSAMTLLVQKEVAERIVARKKPLDSARGKESILSLSVKAYGTPKYEFTVPRGAFKPAPKVDSAVLTIRDISRKNFLSHDQEELFFKLIRAGFAHKRKFVRNNLTEVGFSSGNIPEKARAEDLSLSDWLALSRIEGLVLCK